MLEKIKNMDSRKRILLVCYAVIAVCLVVLAVYGAKWIKQRNNIKEVQKIAKVEEEGNEKLDFAKLQEINPDIYAWIYIPGTKVNYPVLQSSKEEEEDYYLDHNLDGSDGRPGCIYTQKRNSKDFSDPNTVIYGHNMKDGSMFRDLHEYKDEEFFKENPYIYIYTSDRNYTYQIFAAYRYDNRYILEEYDDFKNSQAFENYLTEILSQENSICNIDKNVAVTSEDRIVTLSTCIGNSDYRYLVQGKLIKSEEAENTTKTVQE